MEIHFPETDPLITSQLSPYHVYTTFKQLKREVDALTQRLSPNEELIATIFLFGGAQLHVLSFAFAGPNLLIVEGLLNGIKVVSYVHQHSLQVVFSIVAKDVEHPRQPIGFVIPPHLENPEISQRGDS